MANDNEDQPDFRHPLYDEHTKMWRRCRIAVEGQDAVKAAGTDFLPPLTDQNSDSYNRYKTRALFYDASARTTQSMVGSLTAKEPELVVPKQNEEFFDSLVPKITPIKSFIRSIAKEIIVVGRTGILVDMSADNDGDPYLIRYNAEDIINWRTAFSEGEEKLVLVVLEETQKIEGAFSFEEFTQFRVLQLGEDGLYSQQLWRYEKGDPGKLVPDGAPIVPKQGGKKGFDKIPFFFINATGTSPEPVKPPLLGLVDVNFSHYMSSADLEHGRHLTGIPTMFLAGFKPNKGQKFYIGSEEAFVAETKEVSAGYIEFTGQGLGALETAMTDKERLMQTLGASLLEPPKSIGESAENQRLKRSGQDNVLASIADALSEGLSQASRFCAMWRRYPDFEEVKITISKEYMPRQPDAQLLNTLLTMLNGRTISYETFWETLGDFGIAPDGIDADAELERILNGEWAKLLGTTEPSKEEGAETTPAPPSDDEEDDLSAPASASSSSTT